MKNHLWTILKIWILLHVSTMASADTLVFQNGDRLSGTYLGQEDGLVFFTSDILGPMEIDASIVEVVLDTATDDVVATPAPPAELDDPRAPPPEPTLEIPAIQVATEDGIQEGTAVDVITAEEEDIDFWLTLFDRMPGFLRSYIRNWNTQLSVSYTFTNRTSDRQDIDLRLRTERNFGSNDVQLRGRYDYSFVEDEEGNETRVEDRYNGSLRWRYNFSDRLFAQNFSSYEKNTVREIDHDVEQSIGVGWRFLDRERYSASITPAVTFRYQSRFEEEGEWEPQTTLYQEFRIRLTDRLRFTEESTISLDANDTSNYTYEFTAEFTADLTSFLDANLTYELEYESGVDDEMSETNSKLQVGLGLDF